MADAVPGWLEETARTYISKQYLDYLEVHSSATETTLHAGNVFTMFVIMVTAYPREDK